MNQEQYERLKPFKDRWLTFKTNHAMKWSGLEILAFQQAHKDLFGYVTANIHCGNCQNEMVHKVFNAFEEYESKI
jgi:hypothetical protein